MQRAGGRLAVSCVVCFFLSYIPFFVIVISRLLLPWSSHVIANEPYQRLIFGPSYYYDGQDSGWAGVLYVIDVKTKWVV